MIQRRSQTARILVRVIAYQGWRGGSGGRIACSGIRILLQHEVNRRESIIIAASLGVGFLSLTAPEIFVKLPHFLQMFFESGIVSGGVTAMIVHQILPKEMCIFEADEDDIDDCDDQPEFLFNKHGS